MKRLLTSITMLVFCTALSMADGGQKVTIGGRTVEKNVTHMEFRGDNVVLTFDDASTQTADMSEVAIQFDNATGMNSVQVRPKQAYTPGKPTYSLAGQRVKNPSKGIYVQDGKKVIVK